MRPGGPLRGVGKLPAGYERGRISFTSGRLHAMRPAGIVDARGRRLTLCGLLAYPGKPRFSPTGLSHEPPVCLTCLRVADVRPSQRPVRPADDLAALRTLLDIAAIEVSRGTAGKHPTRRPVDILNDLLAAA